MPVPPNVTNADAWIDHELASLRQSIELPGENASTESSAAPLPRRRTRGSARRARMPVRTIVRRVRHELHARGFDIVVAIAATLGSIGLGAPVALLLE
jgi:hypothetical protein